MSSASPTDRIPLWPVDVVVVVGLGLLAWPALMELCVGPSSAAFFLSGPDAGEWALNAQLVAEGAFDRVDQHRMPTFLLVLAAVFGLVDDIAWAGHLVSAVAWGLQPLALYALGRLVGGRLVGLLAGLLVLGAGMLVQEAALFGVDPLLSLLLPVAMTVALGSRRLQWPAALGAGAVAALACCTHLLALPYVIPAVILTLWPPASEAPPAMPLKRLAAFVVGFGAVVLLFELTFDLISPVAVIHAVSEGISKGTGAPSTSVLSDAAHQQLAQGQGEALRQATHIALSPFQSPNTPWVVGVLALWIGILGPGLRVTEGLPKSPPSWAIRWLGRAPVRRWRAVRAGWWGRLARWWGRLGPDLAVGLVLLSCLAPVPVLAAANSPFRYAITLLPFVALMLARGVAAVVHTPMVWAPPRARLGWAVVVGLGVASWVGMDSHTRLSHALSNLPTPTASARMGRVLSEVVKREFPGDGAVASPMREVPAYLGRAQCPRTTWYSTEVPDTVPNRLEHMRASCHGEGPIPFIWFPKAPYGMGDDAMSQAVGLHAFERWGERARLIEGELEAVVIAVPRVSDKAAGP